MAAMNEMELGEIDRRGLLQCMGWAGTGALYALSGGVAYSRALGGVHAAMPSHSATSGVSFVQISDTHIGFNRPANPDPLATLRETIAKVRALPVQPAFVLHTGDITHLATPEQFDTAQQLLSELALPIHFVPGEHDIVDGTNPQPYLNRFGHGSRGNGWYSFDINGAHFIGLVNVLQLGNRGMGTLGADQIAWLRDDVSHLSSSTPIIVFSHFPMWALYPDWGWGTADAAAALVALRRFGSVTVLNGHIHQVQQRVEGHVTFHTARSTAYPQPAPGVGPGPGPMLVPPERLRSALGVTSVNVRQAAGPLAIIDATLDDH